MTGASVALLVVLRAVGLMEPLHLLLWMIFSILWMVLVVYLYLRIASKAEARR